MMTPFSVKPVQSVHHSKAVASSCWARVHGSDLHAVLRRCRGGTLVGQVPTIDVDIKDRVGFFSGHAPKTPRAVIFEAAPKDPGAGGEQRGGESVSYKPLYLLTVKGEGQRSRPVNLRAKGLVPPAAHRVWSCAWR